MSRTLGRPVTVRGAGLHGGQAVEVELRPGGPGVVFRRLDLGGAAIPARPEHVVDTRLCTTLGAGGARVAVVEHLMAALRGAGVDHAEVLVSGPELPALDGSAREWLALLDEAGQVDAPWPVHPLHVDRAVSVGDAHAGARLSPGPGLLVSCRLDFPHPLLRARHVEIRVTTSTFREEIAWARTFGFLKDAEALRAAGLARGATLENTLVYDEEGPLSPPRGPDEAARHKILDALGDLALLGAPLEGHLELWRSGHAVHAALAQALLAAGRGHG